MSYQKNDVLTVKIEDMGHDGEGIGKCEGYTLFVKDTVIGDLAEVKVIKAKKNYGYARLMRLIEPSAPPSYTHLRAHETVLVPACRLLPAKKKLDS